MSPNRLESIADELQGWSLSLQDLPVGLPVLLIFYSSSCPTCRYSAPFIARLADRFADRKARFRALTADSAEQAEAFATEYGWSFPVLILRPGTSGIEDFAVEAVPTLLLLGGDGREIFRSAGFVRTELEQLNALLSGPIHPGTPLFEADDKATAFRPG